MDLTTAHAKDRTKAGFTYVGSAGWRQATPVDRVVTPRECRSLATEPQTLLRFADANIYFTPEQEDPARQPP